ncbi:MAG: nodulation protein NfeD [Candidatus Bathyarchaeia archaeon]|nr:nodulation protein NfeD [Candidatus Bathyarchaeota archaeon]
MSVRLEGTISSMSYELVGEALMAGERGDFSAVLLLIDTPGGLLDATMGIVELIERSRVPVIGYVYPPGGKAWSAGTYILMATHIAAMSPNTLIGSAQPVSFEPLGGGSRPIEDPKTLNALEKYMMERARAHGRSEEVAKRFVRENLNLNDEDALSLGVIEVRAKNVEELLEKVDGREVEASGRTITLRTSKAGIIEWSPSLRVRLLGFISEPILAYLLFIVGFWTLIFGLSTPGLGAEMAGGLLLLLGLIGLGLMGANLGAILLILVGFALLLAEFLTPGFSILGGGGLVCLLLGSLLLFPGEWAVGAEWLNTLYTVMIVVPLSLGAFFIFVAYKVVTARRRRPFEMGIVGETAEAVGEIKGEGFVRLRGEMWRARSETIIKDGGRVKVVGKEGPILIVEPIKEKISEIKSE